MAALVLPYTDYGYFYRITTIYLRDRNYSNETSINFNLQESFLDYFYFFAMTIITNFIDAYLFFHYKEFRHKFSDFTVLIIPLMVGAATFFLLDALNQKYDAIIGIILTLILVAVLFVAFFVISLFFMLHFEIDSL